jgi:putative two-component system response regulator
MPETAIKGKVAKPQASILILEDSRAQAESLNDILSDAGYSVVRAGDGVEGLRALAASRPSLIISDIWMPRLNGYEFCRAVKDNDRTADIPIMLLSSLSHPKDIAMGLNAGADYYLTKPYNGGLLLSMVDSIIVNWDPSRGRDGAKPLEMRAGGRTEPVSADPQQILNFLFSTYENLLSHNHELTRTQRELKSINGHLEERIKEKMLSLEHEVTERKKTHDTLKRMLEGTVVALARAVEMRDPYTAGHQMRVSDLALKTAKAIGFPKDRLEGIKVMGLLHDIGKIIVPAEILAKPRKLSEYEFLFIKSHSQAGYDILKEIEFPWPVAKAVQQHHERLNGTGYPLGLSGDEIIQEARILAIADVVESMSSHRPYRPALGIEAAMKEIADNKGVLYDPEAVDALLSIL